MKRSAVGEVVEQFVELLAKIVRGSLAAIALQREGDLGTGARGAADAQVDPAGEKSAQHTEGFGDFERAVVRQHDSAAADAQTRCGRGDGADQRFRTGARQTLRSMVLGDPVAGIAEAIGKPREVDRIAQRIAGGRSFGDRGLIENTEAEIRHFLYGISGKSFFRNSDLHRRQFLHGGASLLAASFVSRLHAAEYSTRVVDLVTQSNVIDMLGLLTLDWPLLDRWQSAPENFGEADFRKLRASGIDVFHPAVAFEDARAYAITREWFDKWNRLIDQHPGWFLRIDECADLARAKKEQKIGIMLGMQDANHLRDLDDIDAFYKMGQRLTQLTYNSPNRLGAGCKAASDRGLTGFGQAVVTRMNALGMAIDVSHCGERTTLDAIAASKSPVLITHSNCKALARGVPRCKTDEAIVAAARKGGVIGLTGVRHFVRAGDPVTIEDALDHFDHAVKIAGIEHVGLGSDTDLNGRGPGADIAGLNHVDRVYELTEGLIRRGYTDKHIGLILGGNFQRALQQIRS